MYTHTPLAFTSGWTLKRKREKDRYPRGVETWWTPFRVGPSWATSQGSAIYEEYQSQTKPARTPRIPFLSRVDLHVRISPFAWKLPMAALFVNRYSPSIDRGLPKRRKPRNISVLGVGIKISYEEYYTDRIYEGNFRL